MADWANLPGELLSQIAQRLTYLEDFFCFGAVCKSWEAVVALEKTPSLPLRCPSLVYMSYIWKDEESSEVKEVNPIIEPVYSTIEVLEGNEWVNPFILRCCSIALPEFCSRAFGTEFGWLLTLVNDLQLKLFHPFSGHQIQLPPHPRFNELCDSRHPSFSLQYDPAILAYRMSFRITIKKVVLSSNPGKKLSYDSSRTECIVMAIFSTSHTLAFARVGDSVWTIVRMPIHYCMDVVYFKHQFYVIGTKAALFVCDIDQTPSGKLIAPEIEEVWDAWDKYLVASSEDLYLVVRNPPNRKIKVKWVYKLEECTGIQSIHRYRWTKVDNLGNLALFVGSSSVSLLAPGTMGSYKPNHIYFTNDHDLQEPHVGLSILDMETGNVVSYNTDESKSECCLPFWSR